MHWQCRNLVRYEYRCYMNVINKKIHSSLHNLTSYIIKFTILKKYSVKDKYDSVGNFSYKVMNP